MQFVCGTFAEVFLFADVFIRYTPLIEIHVLCWLFYKRIGGWCVCVCVCVCVYVFCVTVCWIAKTLRHVDLDIILSHSRRFFVHQFVHKRRWRQHIVGTNEHRTTDTLGQLVGTPGCLNHRTSDTPHHV
jgi:hypothetical protein